MELMVTMFFLILMSTIVISRYSAAQSVQKARLAGNELVSMFRRAQSDALSGKIFQGCTFSGGQKAGNVGVFLNAAMPTTRNGVTVFYDKDSSRHCNNSCTDDCGILTGEKIERKSLPGGVTIGLGTGSANAFAPKRGTISGVNSLEWSVLFTAPDPRITICRGSYLLEPLQCDYTSLTINLYSADGTAFFPITIHTSGRIDTMD